MKAYNLSLFELEKHYKTNSITGLSSDHASHIVQVQGYNEIISKKRSLILVFLQQFLNPLIYLLIGAAALIYFLGHSQDAFIISAVLFFNALMGTIQEGRSRSLLYRLKKLEPTFCVVLRDNKKVMIEIRLLVPGDIIFLHEGEQVPADARIIESENIRVNETLFSGESHPIQKHVRPLEGEHSLFEQDNMLFKGTYITAGRCKAVVVATGIHTYIGILQKQSELYEIDLPLKKQLEVLTHKILLLIIGICFALFIIGTVQGKTLTELLVILTALFICVVPEALPVIFTIVLVTGAYRLSRSKVWVKRLQAVEGLGSTDVIILDKTGTLTRNELMVTNIYAQGILYNVSGTGYFPQGNVTHNHMAVHFDEDIFLFAMGKAAALLNTADVHFLEKLSIFEVKGDPTEAALGAFARKLGFTPESIDEVIFYTHSFTSDFPVHFVVIKHQDGVELYGAGAPEVVEMYCTSVDKEGLYLLLNRGLRVLAFFHYQQTQIPENIETLLTDLKGSMTFLGYCGIQDSIRKSASELICQAQKAGLKIIMATGDHKHTAEFVAKQAGISFTEDQIIGGTYLETLSDEYLAKIVQNIKIFARVTPEHKLRIIKAFHANGSIVAMTGDGMNDVPSLVAADIGIAMGASGADIAKEAADIVLLNDNIVTIIQAISEGRHIFYTLRRVILYFFATNIGEIFVIFFALLLQLPLPILAAHILWLNLVTDGFLDISLAAEKHENNLFTAHYLHKKTLIDKNMWFKIIYMGIFMSVGSLYFFNQFYQLDIIKARTMTLICMALFQLFNAWNCRSEKGSVFTKSLSDNPWLVIASLVVFILQILVTQIGFLQKIFVTVPLTFYEWASMIGIASSILWVEELLKLFNRTKAREI